MTASKRLALQAALFLALIAVAANLQGLAVAAIGCYQAAVPDGWKKRCAFLHLLGQESCSVFAKRRIGEAGFIAGMGESLRRFEACGSLRVTRFKGENL